MIPSAAQATHRREHQIELGKQRDGAGVSLPGSAKCIGSPTIKGDEIVTSSECYRFGTRKLEQPMRPWQLKKWVVILIAATVVSVFAITYPMAGRMIKQLRDGKQYQPIPPSQGLRRIGIEQPKDSTFE